MKDIRMIEVDGDEVAVRADWGRPESPIWVRWSIRDAWGDGPDEGWEPTPWQVADCRHSGRRLRAMLARQCAPWDAESTANHLADWLDTEASVTADSTDVALDDLALEIVEQEAEEGIPLSEEVVLALLHARRARLRQEGA